MAPNPAAELAIPAPCGKLFWEEICKSTSPKKGKTGCMRLRKSVILGSKLGLGIPSKRKVNWVFSPSLGCYLDGGGGAQIAQTPTDAGVGRQLQAAFFFAPIFYERDVARTAVGDGFIHDKLFRSKERSGRFY